MKNNFQSERGVSILLAVMILSVILSIALGSSDIAIRQVQSMEGIGDSVVAFYAADHGIEQVMVMTTPISISETLLGDDGAFYEVTVIDGSATSTDDCDAENYCITSIGSYRDAKRAIQSTY